MKRLLAGLVAIVVLVNLAACSRGGDGEDAIVAAPSGPAQTLFVVGSGTSVADELPDSLRQAWPRLLFTEAFPPSTVLVNGAAGPSTVADAVTRQLPLARELHPETVAVWLGSFDLNQGTPVPDFSADLEALLDGLVAATPRVAIANLPRLPAYDEPQRLAYNVEIRAAARASGAQLVDIADLTITPVSNDADYQPDAAGHRAIAEAFAEVLAQTTVD